METVLKTETVEGEIGIVIDYEPGKTCAIDVLQTAMDMVNAMDKLDAVLLSSIDTHLEPVSILIETAMGDVSLPDLSIFESSVQPAQAEHETCNTGTEYFKVKSPDMLGSAQWTIQRNKRSVRVSILHQDWLKAYHQRKFALLPGDSLKCKFEERVLYDQNGTEIERRLAIIEVLDVISPPTQQPLL